MSFEKFIDNRKSFKPRAIINCNGLMSLNQGTTRRYGVNDYNFAVLYYDKDNKKIGFEMTNDENAEGAIKIRKRISGVDLGIKSFISYYNICNSGTYVCDISICGNNTFLIINLANGIKKQPQKKKSEKLNDR